MKNIQVASSFGESSSRGDTNDVLQVTVRMSTARWATRWNNIQIGMHTDAYRGTHAHTVKITHSIHNHARTHTHIYKQHTHVDKQHATQTRQTPRGGGASCQSWPEELNLKGSSPSSSQDKKVLVPPPPSSSFPPSLASPLQLACSLPSVYPSPYIV